MSTHAPSVAPTSLAQYTLSHTDSIQVDHPESTMAQIVLEALRQREGIWSAGWSPKSRRMKAMAGDPSGKTCISFGMKPRCCVYHADTAIIDDFHGYVA